MAVADFEFGYTMVDSCDFADKRTELSELFRHCDMFTVDINVDLLIFDPHAIAGKQTDQSIHAILYDQRGLGLRDAPIRLGTFQGQLRMQYDLL